MNFETWLDTARSLSKSRNSVNWELGDHLNFGKRTFGNEAITAVQKVTRWTAAYVRRVAVISERFPAEKRLPEVSWYIHQRLQPFPPEITDKLLPLAAEKNIGARRLYAMACEMAGEDPADRTKNRTKKVAIPAALYATLRERANGGKVSKLAQQAIEEWLVGKPVERKPSGARTEAWKEQVLATPKEPEPAEQTASPPATAPETVMTVPEPSLLEQQRPTYAERRQAQLAAGTKPIAAKNSKKVQVLWTECRPKSFIQDDEGRTSTFRDAIRPTCFKTQQDADAANEVFKKERGYAEEIVYCELHRAWHLRHIYSMRSTPVEQALLGQ